MNEAGRNPYHGKTTRRQHTALLRVLLLQLLLTVLSLILLYVTVDKTAAISAMLGGLIYLVPSAVQLVHIIFVPYNANNIGQTLGSLYKSEIWKMALMGTLFAVVFVVVEPIEPFSLFGVFVLLQLTTWITAVLLQPGRAK